MARQNAIKKMFVFSLPFAGECESPAPAPPHFMNPTHVCAFESPGLRALGCHWLPRPPMAPSSVLNWPPTPRAREQQCFRRTSAGTVPSCCSKRSIGYVLSPCRSGSKAIRKWFIVSHFYSLAAFFPSKGLSQGVNLFLPIQQFRINYLNGLGKLVREQRSSPTGLGNRAGKFNGERKELEQSHTRERG